jgi:dipeptidyl aminopeptidase/acylaminoacyl peptidase
MLALNSTSHFYFSKSHMFHKFANAAVLLAALTLPSWALDVRTALQDAESGKNKAALVISDDLKLYWSAGEEFLMYRVNTGRNEYRFYQVDTATGTKSEAFDHDLLAKALNQISKQLVKPKQLPIDDLESINPESLRFQAFGKSWQYLKTNHSIGPDDQAPKIVELIDPDRAMKGTRENGEPTSLTIENATPSDIEMFWVDSAAQRKSYGKLPSGQSAVQQTYTGHVWLIADANGSPLAGIETPPTPSLARISKRVDPLPKPNQNLSPDGKWRAIIINHNLVVEPTGSGNSITLTTDGSKDHRYSPPFHWSPDSKKLVAFRTKSITSRQIAIVQSSPPDQLQPKLKAINYPKPGDPISQPMPHLFNVNEGREIAIDQALFSNPWRISEVAWSLDSSEFSFVYNQRGHQVMRVVGIQGDSGSARTVFEDLSETFIDYSQKFFLHRLPATREFLWASERDGFNRLYLIEEESGRIKNAITEGSMMVKEVVQVDDEKRQLLLKVVGLPDQDPYHEHFVRVNFDGTGLLQLTTGDGTHRIEFSPERKWIIDRWSRVDQPQVVELRDAESGRWICEVERADDAALIGNGWSRPERFVAKGRDGKTDIYGIIIRPSNFDPTKKYPVLEDIYAGPHDHFVPKDYAVWSRRNTMADLGFIVVSIDGMGTNWRGRKFHDVCWKNLADSGFPDRIPWIKAAAATRPWMDLSRVGIYGGSAGGQSTLAGLLHHGDFYKVGVADCGCHDNRMDKIWWNEAWMGWPVDESYARNSNVTHAAKLTGKLLLVVGELDTNVDPASTAQVVSALQKAGKDFDYLPIMNAGHGAAETPCGKYRRAEFLMRNLGVLR